MAKPKRCTNSEMAHYTTLRYEFKNNNGSCFARWHWNTKVYAVYSYGTHFPMYLYDTEADQWYGNQDKYSRTTSCHQNQARPRTDHIRWVDTKTLQTLILCQGVAGAVTHRIATAIAERYESALTAA